MCFLFLDPQDEIGPSISSSVVLCSFVLLVYIHIYIISFIFIILVSSTRSQKTYLFYFCCNLNLFQLHPRGWLLVVEMRLAYFVCPLCYQFVQTAQYVLLVIPRVTYSLVRKTTKYLIEPIKEVEV